MYKPGFKILPEYTTSLIPITRLEEIQMFEYNNEYQQLNDNAKARLIGRQNENGGWDVINRLVNSDEGVILEDLSFEEMIVQVSRGEDIFLMSEPYDTLDLEVFFPQSPHMVPEKEDIALLKKYINQNNPPHNHICKLMLQIGQEKRENNRLSKKLDSESIGIAKDKPYRPSIRGINGQKLFLN